MRSQHLSNPPARAFARMPEELCGWDDEDDEEEDEEDEEEDENKKKEEEEEEDDEDGPLSSRPAPL